MSKLPKELTTSELIILMANNFHPNFPDEVMLVVLDGLVNRGLIKADCGYTITKAGRDYLKDMRIVIVDATDMKYESMYDASVITQSIEDGAEQSDGIGYVKL